MNEGPRLIGEISIRLFVRHGDQQMAMDFYENVAFFKACKGGINTHI